MTPTTATSAKAVDLDRSAVARYLQLSTLFRRRIEYGEWPVGQQIPTVEELTKACGVAPATIRKALDSLVAEGLIARYRAKGTFVLRSPVQSLWSEIEPADGVVLRARSGATIKLISSRIVKAPPLLPAEGELADSYRHLRRVYWRDNRSFMLTDLYLDAALAKSLSRADLRTKTARELTGRLSTAAGALTLQTLTISSADIEAANFLSIPLNAPVARIDRTRIDGKGRAIAISTSIYRGDVVRLDFRGKETG